MAVRWNALDPTDEHSPLIVPSPDLRALEAEVYWRRRVMSEAKTSLACGDPERAYAELTRHEKEGYPWAPGAPSNSGPEVAHDALRSTALTETRRSDAKGDERA